MIARLFCLLGFHSWRDYKVSTPPSRTKLRSTCRSGGKESKI